MPNIRPGSGRSEFIDTALRRFSEITSQESLNLTFWFGVFGAPWRHEWNGPNVSSISRRDEQTREVEIEKAVLSAMRGVDGFYPSGFHPDAGRHWMGVQQGHGRDETRLYDREPIIVSSVRYPTKQFSVHWFEPT